MPRQTIPLKYDWKFTRDDDADSMAAGYDDAAWETVRVPHDWAISGPFDRKNDLQLHTRKQADIEVGVLEMTGRTGGLPHVGVGWYRRTVDVPADDAGKPVHCYTSFNTVELFLNGKSLGRRSKRVKMMMGTYRLVWPDVRYAPGELKAVAYDNEGSPVAETVVKTAGPAAAIELTLDRESIDGDGDDMAFATVRILDADGNLCPTADNLVQFRIEGPAEIAAVGNGNAISLEPFQADCRKAFNGMCMVYLRSIEAGSGPITLYAESEELEAAENGLRVEILSIVHQSRRRYRQPKWTEKMGEKARLCQTRYKREN